MSDCCVICGQPDDLDVFGWCEFCADVGASLVAAEEQENE